MTTETTEPHRLRRSCNCLFCFILSLSASTVSPQPCPAILVAALLFLVAALLFLVALLLSMGPRTKKHKPNSQAPIDQPPAPRRDTDPDTDTPTPPDKHVKDVKDGGTNTANKTGHKSDTPSPKSDRRSSTASWYSKTGSWRAKASPVAQATCESISVAGGATSEALADGSARVGRYMHNSLKRNSKSIPSLPSESRINATGSSTTELDKSPNPGRPSSRSSTSKEHDQKELDTNHSDRNHVDMTNANNTAHPKTTESVSKPCPDDAPLPPDPPANSEPDTTPAQKTWWGWWSRPDEDKASHPDNLDTTEASTTPLPSTPAEEHTNTARPDDTTTHKPATPVPIDTPVDNHVSNNSTRSWFGRWSTAQNTKSIPHPSSTTPAPEATESISPQTLSSESSKPSEPPSRPKPSEPPSKPPSKSKPTDSSPLANPPESSPHPPNPPESSSQPKSTGWAFWSRERKDDGETSTPNGTQRQVGELAVADTPSQSHPEAAQFNQKQNQKSRATPSSTPSTSPKDATNSSANAAAVSSAPISPSNSPPRTRSATPDLVKPLDPVKSAPGKSTKTPARPPNMVMPSFRETYSPVQIPTYWERVTQYVASSLRLIDTPMPENHVAIAPTLPKVRNAVAIGVHGYFPAPLIQKVLGPPTGTSIRFANYASAAVRAWAGENQPDTPCEIETVALEGEGFIADRVNTLWKLLLNWLSHLRQADLIFVACHSQGVPVAIMLVSKLIQLGCLSPHAKIGICAMAGVNLGPFADYKTRLLGAGSAAELFEFSNPASKVSMEYATALDVVLRHSVRITYVGSIDDQLVSLESSTFSTLTHPYVYRCVFVDGRIHAPDFITHLVAFTLKLRNLGISDHGLIRELSLPLAGSLYGGQGHSTVYDDPDVYKLALQFTLETTDLVKTCSSSDDPQSLNAQARRSSRAGPPSSVTAANALRRGSVSAASVTGIPPVLAPFELPASGSNANPYFLPWALRGIVEEEVVKRDMGDQVRELVKMFEEWRPVSKVLKDVRFRLEGVRSTYRNNKL